MNAGEIVEELRAQGSDSYKNVILKHGAREPVFGVKIEEMKKIVRRAGKQYSLALDLFDTGIYDAQYLAGLIADETRMTREDLQRWLRTANSGPIREWTVSWIAAESEHGWELGREWIENPEEGIAAAGWSTLGSLVGVREDADLDLAALERLMERVASTIQTQPDRVRQTMNGFLIAVGVYVAPLTDRALQMAEQMGKVTVVIQGTSCKTPYAPDYIRKAQARGSLGSKRKTARC